MRAKRFAWWGGAFLAVFAIAALCLSQQGYEPNKTKELESYFPYLSTLVRTLRAIDRFYVDEVDVGNLLRHGTRRLVSSLDSRSTVQFADEENKRQADLGLNVMSQKGLFVVISRETNSPSDGSDVLPGDRIVAINERPVYGLTLDELRRYLRGVPESKVTLTVYGPDDFSPRKVNLHRAMYISKPADFAVGDDWVVYFRIRRFADGVSKTFKRALASLGSSEPRGIIIDVRNNIGGSIKEVTNILSRFESSKPLFLRSTRDGIKEVARDSSVALMPKPVPVVIIVNKRTVGEAEVLAASLRGHGIAKLVGEKTFGFALGTDCISTSDGTRVILSTCEYEGPFGQKLHKVGLTPDIIVPMDRSSSEDTQLEKARETVLNWTPIPKTPPAAKKPAA
nr:PDZ domain-containing protein [Bacillota bacterium]